MNDNAPEFDASIVKISVPENAELQTPIYVAHATDADSAENGAITYTLARSNPFTNVFSIDRYEGILTLVSQLDYEKEQRYILLITAKDNGTPSLYSNLTVDIEVQDVNDNSPKFTKSAYRVNVIESTEVNTQFLQVSATDKDTGNNARLTYRLKDDVEHFSIFPNSGSIYLKSPLDREKQDMYSLTVISTDNGSPSRTATATVSIYVLDANDNAPTFIRDSYEFTVEENGERGVYVGTLGATDPDQGNNASIRYSLIPGNGSFQVNPLTGKIELYNFLANNFSDLLILNLETWVRRAKKLK